MGDERHFGNRCKNCGHWLPEPGALCGNCFGNWTPPTQVGEEQPKKGTKKPVTANGMVRPDGNKCPKCGAFLSEPGDDCPRCRVKIFPGTNHPPYPNDQVRT